MQLDQRTVGAERHEGFHEYGGLHRHVEASGDAGAGEGFGRPEFFAGGHEAGHFMLGEREFLATPIRERNILDSVFQGMGTFGDRMGRR